MQDDIFDPETLNILSYDRSPATRIKVIRNPFTSLETLHQISLSETNAEVLMSLVKYAVNDWNFQPRLWLADLIRFLFREQFSTIAFGQLQKIVPSPFGDKTLTTIHRFFFGLWMIPMETREDGLNVLHQMMYLPELLLSIPDDNSAAKILDTLALCFEKTSYVTQANLVKMLSENDSKPLPLELWIELYAIPLS